MLKVAAAGSNGGFASQLQSSGECSDDELAVLPRHTKVVVTGNNRTKSVLVGLRGVVKKAVGLGGWHWLVLTNGIEVKLQRNALSVVEAATGNEVDEDLDFDTGQWSSSGITASDDTQKSYRSRHRMHKSFGPSRKTLSTSLSSSSDSKDSLSTQKVSPVDLGKLEVGALWRYLQHFNLVDGIHNPPSREELTDIVQRHFMSQQLDDLQVIKGLVTSAKRLKTGYERTRASTNGYSPTSLNR